MLFRDAFTAWLEREHPQTRPRVYQPGGFLGYPPQGWEITLHGTRLVYRIPEEKPDLFYIVLIERAESRRGLSSPLAALPRVLRLLQQSQTGVRWIRGHIAPSSDRPADALTAEQLFAFYNRYLTAVDQGVENGVAWCGGDLTRFDWSLEKHKIRGHSPVKKQ